MRVLAAASQIAPTIIDAIPGLVSAVLVYWVARRAQRAEEQLEQIRKIVAENGEHIVDQVKQALRDVIGSHPARRRWYE